jgi:hypothetical protein
MTTIGHLNLSSLRTPPFPSVLLAPLLGYHYLAHATALLQPEYCHPPELSIGVVLQVVQDRIHLARGKRVLDFLESLPHHTQGFVFESV